MMTDELGVTMVDTKPNVVFTTNDTTEMLRIEKDGFYVRGVKVEQDAFEAEHVYKAFHQWLTWATLTRDYNG
jgi:hypothetical protein